MKMKNVFRTRVVALALSCLLVAPGETFAQTAKHVASQNRTSGLTVDYIMRANELIGFPPQDVRWSRDNQKVYFRWKQASESRTAELATYVVNRDGGELRKLTETEADEAPPTGGDATLDKSRTVYVDDGDVFIYDHAANKRRRVTQTGEAETNPRFTKDEQAIYYTRANNLYKLRLDAPEIMQLTDIRTGAASASGGAQGAAGAASTMTQRGSASSSEARGTESQELLKREEKELLDAVRERAEVRERREKRVKENNPRKAYNLPPTSSVASLGLAPDESFVVAAISDAATGARNTVVPNYVTESAYTETIPSRTKVGDVQGRSRLVMLDVKTGESRNVELPRELTSVQTTQTGSAQTANTQTANIQTSTTTQTSTPLQQTTEQVGQQAIQGQATQQQQTAQSTQSTQGQTSQQSTQQQSTQTSQQQTTQTSQQQTTQQQTQQSVQTGQTTEAVRQGTQTQTQAQTTERAINLFQMQWSDDGRNAVMLARSSDNKERYVLALDSATGKSRVLVKSRDEAWTGGPGAFTLGWLPDNKTVYYIAEDTGFAHLYSISIDANSKPVQLTSGRFEVSDVRLSNDKSKFFFTSSEGSFFERHLYSMPTSGGARTRLTTMSGNNAADISPDETMLAIVRSYSNEPPEVFLQTIGATANDAKRVTTSPVAEWSNRKWIDPPIVSFKARDGADVFARLYKPANLKRGAPAVVFVHGAGYLQNVHKWWSNYFREYMFHHLLMEKGYIVLDIDYRGSAGYGRGWRTGIYRFMGGKDLTDHLDAAQYLVREHNADPKKLGIYGGSYGGFITFMAMFTAPDTFAAGAALRPVTDWAHYNHPYTSNILNLPQADRESYEKSSPIYHASGLKGALLICHGMVDTNVHFQDSVRLVQKLIELRKENWELAVYPVEDHAFERADSWADEYKRILKLFEVNLRLKNVGQERRK